MASKFRSEETGLLLVFMEPGSKVSLSEFHDWYDNEHVPLRINKFKTFRSAARYETVSSLFPTNHVSFKAVKESSWGAYYTISSNDVFGDQAYTCLRSQRSEREAELFSRLAVVDRRTYKLCYDSDLDERIHSTKKDNMRVQTKKEVEKYSNTIVAHSVTPANEQEYMEWFDQEHTLLLSKVPGWSRTRRFELIDNQVNGLEADKEGRDAKEVPKFLGLHEYGNDAFEGTAEYKAAIDTPWRNRVVGEKGKNMLQCERKKQRLYRAWDPLVALESTK